MQRRSQKRDVWSSLGLPRWLQMKVACPHQMGLILPSEQSASHANKTMSMYTITNTPVPNHALRSCDQGKQWYKLEVIKDELIIEGSSWWRLGINLRGAMNCPSLHPPRKNSVWSSDHTIPLRAMYSTVAILYHTNCQRPEYACLLTSGQRL